MADDRFVLTGPLDPGTRADGPRDAGTPAAGATAASAPARRGGVPPRRGPAGRGHDRRPGLGRLRR